MKATIGLELGGSRANAVVVDENGRVLGRADLDSTDARSAATAIHAALSAAATSAVALGVSAPDPSSPEIQPILRDLAQRYAGPFVHDGAMPSGTAAALAECWIGAAQGARDLVYLAVDDHTSAGILHGGVPFLGAHRRGPAAGWLALNPVEREDYRKIGCLEAEVAAAGIVRRIVWRIKAGDHSRIEQWVGGDLGSITVAQVVEAARQGDGVAISVSRDTAKYVGMAAANLVIVADPDVLVLGGIMASSSDLLFDLVRTEIARRLPAAVMQTLKIVPAALQADAAAIGAAKLATAALQ